MQNFALFHFGLNPNVKRSVIEQSGNGVSVRCIQRRGVNASVVQRLSDLFGNSVQEVKFAMDELSPLPDRGKARLSFFLQINLDDGRIELLARTVKLHQLNRKSNGALGLANQG